MKPIDYLEFAEYNEIICRLIYEFNMTSQIKIIFTAFSIKNKSDDFIPTRQKLGTFNIILDGIKSGLSKGFGGFAVIFDCLELLKNTGFISVTNGIVCKNGKIPLFSKEISCMNSTLLSNAISEVEKLTDDSLIRGVIEYV